MIRKLISLSFIIIIYACATVQSPTGGEKDEKAPVLYESTPKDQSINFDGKEIKLFFNEWMKLEQLDNELIITPREDINYEASLKKQELIIELEEPLKDSTTYTFNFRKALKDITEGNLWENPTIAFSTGPFLDSLEISGTVKNIKNNATAESYIVGLYSNEYDTTNLRQGKPIYFTTTDKDGNFQMKNLKGGNYRLYTFEDKNDNLINNSRTEAYGFHPEVIELDDSIGRIDLSTYSRNEDTLKIKKYSPVGKDFIIQYNKGLSKYHVLNPKDSNQHIYTNDIESSSYLKVYKENFPELEFETDSTLLMLEVKDSIGSKRLDSVYFKIRESRIKNDTISIIEKPTGKIQSGNQEFKFRLTKPAKYINYDSIQLRIDSIPIHQFTESEVELDFNKKSVLLKTQIEQKEILQIMDSLKEINQKQQSDSAINNLPDSSSVTDSTKEETIQNQDVLKPNNTENNSQRSSESSEGTLQIYLGKSAFIGIEKDTTKSVSVPLSFIDEEEFGIIKGKVINPGFPFVIELMNEKYEVQDTLINQEEFIFRYVKPGKYRLRLIKDENNNQIWDAGNPLILKKEEEYIYYNEVITVKANWEIIDKNFDFSVDKDVDSSEEIDDL